MDEQTKEATAGAGASKTKSAAMMIRVGRGEMTMNQARTEYGLDPIDVYAANSLLIKRDLII